ncbi:MULTISPECIES: redoxin domain-containing protein [Corallococcus]|uniref:redoxin domain-containing protein n=1 Tax=Corallococcus TaxID=83461 RepID=UPI00117DA8F2|nr:MULTISPECIES: redoxin domain-containing protein [Corallococcus]NBD14523.1 redoxin domain-containing protein [Corallococcus silvisoli]TSC19813.1 redoxin domain-containing protein [Corallococcus sp. Z5C101001]
MATATLSLSRPLPPGSRAPSFQLAVTPAKSVSLADCAGAPVVLAFYPADFSPVCGDELALFNELLPELQRHGARMFGVSVDSVWSHAAFARERGLRFPLLADFHPKGDMSRRYHAWREAEDVSERALYVLDGDGVIAWSHVSPPAVNPGVDGVLDALEKLSRGTATHEVRS